MRLPWKGAIFNVFLTCISIITFLYIRYFQKPPVVIWGSLYSSLFREFNAGDNPAMDWHPIQGGAEIPLVA